MTHDPFTSETLVPRFVGTTAYRVSDCGGLVNIDLGGIENPRDPLDLSGTLSVEFWALPTPYSGGDFQGHSMAGVVIDSIAGGQTRWNASFELPFQPPADGTWNLVLMLREWTGLGYTTRDFVNFAAPVTFPILAGALAPAHPVVIEPTPAPAPAPAAKPTPVAATPKSDARLPLNKASANELTQVKGITKPVAKAIVAARPFKALEDLLDVKGIGAKVFDKIRASLRLD